MTCRSGICRTTTCPGCKKAFSPSSTINVPVVIKSKEFTVCSCTCTEGRLFAIWALSCGWYRPTKSSERKRSSGMVDKIRSHLHKPSTNPGTQSHLPPNNPSPGGLATSKGVGYGSSFQDHLVKKDPAVYKDLMYLGHLPPEKVNYCSFRINPYRSTESYIYTDTMVDYLSTTKTRPRR